MVKSRNVVLAAVLNLLSPRISWGTSQFPSTLFAKNIADLDVSGHGRLQCRAEQIAARGVSWGTCLEGPILHGENMEKLWGMSRCRAIFSGKH